MASKALGMISSKILFICIAITAATSYPTQQHHLLNVPTFSFPHEYSHTEQRPVTFNKHFHFYQAAEETDTLDDDEIIPETLLTKNVRVVVIKSPENKKATAAIARLAKTLADEKTAIYVLNKEPDLKEITAQINRLKEVKAEGPEVHFIKYKTPEEAELAAINIQSQYESLNGPSEINNVETAPLHSYVGSLNGLSIDAISDRSIVLSTTPTALIDSPHYVSLSSIATPTQVVNIGSNPQISRSDIINKLLGSTTTISPLDDVLNASTPTAQYLPPFSNLRAKKRDTASTKSSSKKVDKNTE